MVYILMGLNNHLNKLMLELAAAAYWVRIKTKMSSPVCSNVYLKRKKAYLPALSGRPLATI